VNALFQQAGVIRADSLEELVDVAELLSRGGRVGTDSVAILTNAGGLGILCADACEASGLELASLDDATVDALRAELPAEASVANPIDMLGSATAASYAAILPQLVADQHVSAVIALFVPAVSATADEVAAAIAAATEQADEQKPVLAVVMSSEGISPVLRDSRRVSAFAYPESAAKALGRAAERAEWLRRPFGRVPELDGVDPGTAMALVVRALTEGDDVWLEASEVRELLEAYGIALVPERVAGTAEEAARSAAELGFPAVVKTSAAGAHKTDIGGIALDLRDADAVREAAARIGPPVLVQPMIRSGAELLAGVVQDPVFGPLVAFGPGGVFAELIGDAGFRIAPLTDVDAEELVTTGKAGKLVAGFRGSPASDAAALVDLVHRLSRLGEDLPAVAELDLNPVLGLPSGFVVVDARARIRRPESVLRAKTW
jgi:acyl-CoA synthetase (NDP forming)